MSELDWCDDCRSYTHRQGNPCWKKPRDCYISPHSNGTCEFGTHGCIVVHSLSVTFQRRLWPWMTECFGPTIPLDKMERNHRFLEEALELVQACYCTADEAHQLVDYVYGRPVGEKSQEVGGVVVTLAALCN